MRQLADFLAVHRRALSAMVALSVGGVLAGLLAPLLLGVLVNALSAGRHGAECWLVAGAVVSATLVETTAYVWSDGIRTRSTAVLLAEVREAMFAGLRRRRLAQGEDEGLSARFLSDAESVGIAVTVVDSGAMLAVECATAFVALGWLAPYAVPVVAAELVLIWLVTRRSQGPTELAGERRQEELEAMTRTLARAVAVAVADDDPADAADAADDRSAGSVFGRSLQRVAAAEVRLGWLEALNVQGSGGLATLGPIAAVVVAGLSGGHRSGTLLALYLVAQRAFVGFDGLVDLRLSVVSEQGAIRRCLLLAGRAAPGPLGR